jgi:3'(2'), 5'-bisphosphate nucleotidase
MESNMDKMAREDRYGIAIRAAIEGGIEIMKVYAQPFDVEYKEDNSPLTIADQNADDIIGKYLAQTMIPVLSEEGAKENYEVRKNWKQCWIVDPLDGTKEFIKRNGEFTVNIAFVESGIPIFGVVYAPALGVMYVGEKGKGAYKVIIPDLFATNLDLRATANLPAQKFPVKFTIVGSRSHASPETNTYVEEQKAIHGEVDFVAAGSSLKFCLVAEGKAHVYPRFAPTMEWDTAAGQAVLEAAGGTLVEWPSKKPMLYNRKELLNSWFLAEAKKSE